MSTVQTWTLWQRLPPRYQLTSRCLVEDEIIAINTDRSQTFKQCSGSSSRPTSGTGSPSPRQQPVPPPATERENFMLGANVPELVLTQMAQSMKHFPQGISFPKRKSDYINHYQTQKRVNSARRRLAESPPSPTVHVNPTNQTDLAESKRLNTAPAFPVTNPVNHNKRRPKLNEYVPLDKKQLTNHATQRPQLTKEPTKVDVFQFDDAKSISNSSLSGMRQDKDPTKKYVIQDTRKATMYIDNGKVIYFGKSRHDLTALLKTQSLRADRSSCFLADLRRDYLKHPKYENHKSKRSDADPKQIACERVNYNKKVEHILNYYCDDAEEPKSRPSSAYRAVTPRGSRKKGLSLAAGAPSRPQSRANSPIPDRPDSPGDYIRLNRQSKLHERHFYLRTPGIKRERALSELEKCRCSMCRIELQLALVTGMSNTLGLAAPGNVEHKHVDTAEKLEKSNVDNNTPKESVDNLNNKDKSSIQKVFFKQQELPPRTQEHTLTISCTLPEMEEVTVSESGIESARVHDVESTVPDNEESSV